MGHAPANTLLGHARRLGDQQHRTLKQWSYSHPSNQESHSQAVAGVRESNYKQATGIQPGLADNGESTSFHVFSIQSFRRSGSTVRKRDPISGVLLLLDKGTGTLFTSKALDNCHYRLKRLHPKPETPNPKPSSINPTPQTLNPKNVGFLKLGVPFWGVPIIRTIVFWDFYWGPTI